MAANSDLTAQRRAYQQVGTIVSQVNRVEIEINKIIGAYYAGDRIRLLIEDVLEDSRMSLNFRLDLFTIIAKRLDPDFDQSDAKKAIQSWRKTRNIVAHGVVGDGRNGVVVRTADGKEHALDGKYANFGRDQESLIRYLRELLEKPR